MRTLQLPSADGKNQIMVYIWEPDAPIEAVLQISHGMLEHMKRYDDFANFLCQNHIAVVGNDHLGHGQSAPNAEELGFFCSENASETVVEDLHRVTKFIKETYPELPVILLGHSMGSFLARRYIENYGVEINGVILSGTGSMPSIVLSFGKLLCKILEKIKGNHHRSQLIKKIAFGSYLNKIPNPRTASDWLCKDEQIVDAYCRDPFCTFEFTVNGYHTLFDTMQYMQKPEHINKIPQDLPVLFVSGDMDPVGNYKEGVLKAALDMQKANLSNVQVTFYPGDRHEILNELDRKEAYSDLLDFIITYTS